MNRGQLKRNIKLPNNFCYKCHTVPQLRDIAKTQKIKGRSKMKKLDLYNSIYGDKQFCEKHSNTEQNTETNTKSKKLFFIIKTHVYDDYKRPESYISVKQQLFEDPNKFMKEFLIEFNDLFNDLFNDEIEIESDTNWFKVLEQSEYSSLGPSRLQVYSIDVSSMKINEIKEFDLGYNEEFHKNILFKHVEGGEDYEVDTSISPKYMKKLLSSLK